MGKMLFYIIMIPVGAGMDSTLDSIVGRVLIGHGLVAQGRERGREEKGEDGKRERKERGGRNERSRGKREEEKNCGIILSVYY